MKYLMISPTGIADWDCLTVVFDYPLAIWWVIYTTDTIEMLNYTWRKRFKTRGASPLNQFVILFGGRAPALKAVTQLS